MAAANMKTSSSRYNAENVLADAPIRLKTPPHWARSFTSRYSQTNTKHEAAEEPAEAPSSTPEPKPWKGEDSYAYLDPCQGDSWSTLRQGIQKHDDERCKGWREDLETLLVFTGLFSAVVTAFIIESFENLSQDSADTTNELLRVLIKQLANQTIDEEDPEADFRPDAADVQINVLYFVSLTLALSVSSVCILAKQWIREFQRDTPGSSCDYVRIRQVRFDALQEWKVPAILAALPVMLQAAVLLFFGGLLQQLWHVGDHTVAAAVTVIVGVAVLLVLVTTVVPAHWSQRTNRQRFTPFRSPQAWIYFAAYQRVLKVFGFLRTSHILGSWVEFDIAFLSEEKEHSAASEPSSVTSVHRALRWVWSVFRNASDMENALFWCLHPQSLPLRWTRFHELQLGLYVFSGEDSHRSNIAPVHSDLSHLGNVRGRLHAEILLKTANLTIEKCVDDTSVSLTALNQTVAKVCKRLSSFDPYAIQESDETLQTHMNIIHEQSVLMLRRYLHVILTRRNPRSEDNNRLVWNGVADLLVMIRASVSATPFAHQVSEELVPRTLQSLLLEPTEASITFLCSMGSSFASMTSNGSRPALARENVRIFYMLDRAMVDMLEQREETATKLRYEWERIRDTVVNRYNSIARAWDDPILPHRYFNQAHPCRALDNLVREALELVAAV